jgi:hypothetical protein
VEVGIVVAVTAIFVGAGAAVALVFRRMQNRQKTS